MTTPLSHRILAISCSTALLLSPVAAMARVIPGATQVTPRSAETNKQQQSKTSQKSTAISSNEKTLVLKAIRSHDKNAMYQLALMYRDGKGVKADSKIAFFWMLYAAESDHVEAEVEFQQMVKGMSFAEYLHAMQFVYGASMGLSGKYFDLYFGKETSKDPYSYPYSTPSTSLADARNAQRRSDVNTILNAIYQYSIDNNGKLPAGITQKKTEICRSSATAEQCKAKSLVDLRILTGSYVVSVPVDPQETDQVRTGYTVTLDANGRVTIAAPRAEESAVIHVTR